MKKYLVWSLIVSMTLTTAAFAEIQVQNLWVRTSTGTTTAAYMKLINTSPQDVYLTNVSSPAAKSCELHTTSTTETGMQMQKISAIRIPANGNISLEPGHTHIMFMNLATPLLEGKTAPLTLYFSDGKQLELIAPI